MHLKRSTGPPFLCGGRLPRFFPLMETTMGRRTPILIILALFVAVSCDRQPAEPPSETAAVLEAPTFAAVGLGAVVTLGDIGCALVDGDGDYYPENFDGNCGVEVATYSKNGNAVWTMRMSGVPNSTGKAVHWGPYNPGWRVVQDSPDLAPGPSPCYMLGPDRDFNNMLMTTNWHEVVTPSGEATVTCIYSKKR